MKKNLSKFYRDMKEPAYEPTDFFMNLLIKVRGKKDAAKLTPKNFSEFINYEDEHNADAEPESILDYDASLFPNHLTVLYSFKKQRLHGFGVFMNMKRLNAEFWWEVWLTLEGHNLYHYPFNLLRLEAELQRNAGKYGLSIEPMEQEAFSGNFNICVEKILPARGNMLAAFNQMWSDIETLYHDSVNGMISQVKTKY